MLGPSREPGEVNVEMIVKSETSERIEVDLRCKPVEPGQTYVISKAVKWTKPGEEMHRFTAKSDEYTLTVTLDASQSAVFRGRKHE